MREVVLAHSQGTEPDELVARRARVADERGDVDALARRGERREPRDALLEQDARAVMIPVAPVMEPDADLQDAVVQAADRRACAAPEQLQGLVLLEELSGVELLDAAEQLGWRWIGAPGARLLVDGAAGDALGRTDRLAVAASGLGRVRRRAASGSGARR